MALLALRPAPASAHIVIRLDIVAPQAGARVGRNTEAVIYAQPMLAGVQQTPFTVALDGETIDPTSGQRQAQTPSLPIHVLSEVHIPLRGLAAGSHRLTVSYRPDRDMLLMTASVSFRVDAPASHIALLVTGGGLASVASLVAGFLLLRRRRSIAAASALGNDALAASADANEWDAQSALGER